MTRDEYDALPSDGKYACPDCGLKTTEYSRGRCRCPSIQYPGLTCAFYIKHINKWHHNCARARRGESLERRKTERVHI